MKIAVMTGGGDCPGINAAIEAIVTRATEYGYEVFGITEGYTGLLNGGVKPLSLKDVEGISRTGGTILGTSRTNPFKTKDGAKKVMDTIKRFGIDTLIAIGGEDTISAACQLSKQGVSVVAVPKTIDNDLCATDYSIGFQTAVDIAAEAIKRLHTTAESHRRVIVVEIMGRNAGWLALMAGLAGGAHIILIPEQPFDIDSVCEVVKRRRAEGKTHTIIAVAEGAKLKARGESVTACEEKDEFGHERLGGIAQVLEKEIVKRTGEEARSVVLGHLQRGGPPNSFDTIMGIRLGLFAVDLVKKKKTGYAPCLRGTEIVPVRIEEMAGKLKTIDESLFELTGVFSSA
jgi:phosphofructokinase-like protein